ncbi:MAG: glycosyltransferase family 2 protein [Syntrophorhabdaceae bacterium]
MPTYNRRKFVPRALEYFLRQDYESRELIILDDGTDEVQDLIPSDGRIHYIRLAGKLTIGAKRNRACDAANGDIILHWDDDDWMADWRARYQAGQLQQADICGLNRVLFFDPNARAAWEYVYPGATRPWVHGATLCYRKSFWKENPFPNRDVGEDLRFIWRNPEAKIVALPENRFIAALIHPDNASTKSTHDNCWSKIPFPDIRALLGKDFPFYADLGPGFRPAAS